MIKVSYEIDRKNGDQIEVYTANKKLAKIPNVCAIRGNNSSGKSTTLNMLAAAFNGVNNPGISDSLKRKLNALLDESHQNIQYEFEIDDDNERILLKRDESGVSTCIVSEGSKSSHYDRKQISANYNLIYDIPEDPTQRLGQLTDTIISKQQNLKDSLKSFCQFLNHEMKDLNIARDDDAIAAKQLEVKKRSEKIKELSKDEDDLQKKYDVVRNYYHLKAFKDAERSLSEINEKVLKYSNEKDKAVRKEAREKVSKNREVEALSNCLNECDTISDAIISSLSEINIVDIKLLEKWKQYRFSDAITRKEIDAHILSIVSSTFESVKDAKSELDSRKNDVEKNRLIDNLNKKLSLLQNEAKDLPDVFEEFDRLKDMLASLKCELPLEVSNYDKLTALLVEFVSLDKNIRDSKDRLASLSKSKIAKEIPYTENDINNMYAAALERQKDLQKNYKAAEQNCIQRGFNPKDIHQVEDIQRSATGISEYGKLSLKSLSDLKTLCDDIMKKLCDKTSEIKRINDRLAHDNEVLHLLELHQPHKYSGRVKDVDAILKKCRSIEKKLEKYQAFLTSIKEHDIKPQLSTDMEFVTYNSVISEYLGKVVKNIRHGEKEYEIDKVDLVKEIFYTKSGNEIYFSDMGTGQSQSAYLLSQLSSAATDSRKMIVLFDEVAMMDEDSLRPIYKKMNQLYEEGKLLVGITVMANREGANDIEVVAV